MGTTLQQLQQTMTAQEFAQHYALECEEPLPAAQWSMAAALLAATANGPLQVARARAPLARGRLHARPLAAGQPGTRNSASANR